jgi:hypothetical protein
MFFFIVTELCIPHATSADRSFSNSFSFFNSALTHHSAAVKGGPSRHRSFPGLSASGARPPRAPRAVRCLPVTALRRYNGAARFSARAQHRRDAINRTQRASAAPPNPRSPSLITRPRARACARTRPLARTRPHAPTRSPTPPGWQWPGLPNPSPREIVPYHGM